MNAPIFHAAVTPVPRYSVAQLIQQETSFYAIQTAKLNKLFEQSGQREEWRNDFLGALENFIAEQTVELSKSAEHDAPLNRDYAYQRGFDRVRL